MAELESSVGPERGPFDSSRLGSGVNFTIPQQGNPPQYQTQVKAIDRQLDRAERGLVVSAPITISPEGTALKSTRLDSQELRFSLLFWDRLDFPTNNLIHLTSGPDESFLEQEGVLSRTDVQVAGSGDITGGFLKAHLAAYRELDRSQPGQWSLARGERSISFPSNEMVPDRGALFSLFEVIPVPDREVPLADILEFRSRRRSELLALRHHLERIYQAIEGAPDRPLAQATELAELDRAVSDHIRAISETKFPIRLSSFQAKLDWKTVVSGIGAAVAASHGGLPLARRHTPRAPA